MKKGELEIKDLGIWVAFLAFFAEKASIARKATLIVVLWRPSKLLKHPQRSRLLSFLGWRREKGAWI